MADNRTSDFNVVLPSNSNLSSHPSNTPDDYTVRLNRPISLVGDWEVALINIHYPHNWFDFTKKVKVYWVYVNDHVGLDKVAQSEQHTVITYNESQQSPVITFDSHTTVRNSHFTFYPAHFSTVQEIGDLLCRQLEQGIKTEGREPGVRITFQYDYETRFGHIHCNYGNLYVYCDSNYLARMIGITAVNIRPHEIDSLSTIELSELFLLHGGMKSQFLKLDSIYVYTNLIQNQYVGDSESPLLGIVPIQKRTQDKNFFVFNPITYLPLAMSNFQDVKIALRTVRGEKLPFPQFTPNVVCTLRFRRCKNAI